MPGLGKTTLAGKIFNDPEIKCKFPTRIWIWVSQVFSKRNIFLSIPSSMHTRLSEDIYDKSDMELAELVVGCLRSEKFLLVMDDVWTPQDWDELRIVLPQNNKRGKVLITSSQMEVCRYVNHSRDPHMLHFLTDEASWELLQLEVFGKLEFPKELEDQYSEELVVEGLRIAENCEGLPLAIVSMGGILVKKLLTLDQTISAMKKVFEEVSGGFNARLRYDLYRCMDNFLSLSYEKLPCHLRKCFLYVGMFPEDYVITALKLIWMWIAEGFIQEEDNLSLEETAEKYLVDLINSNLLRVYRLKADGKVETVRVHSTVYDFCRIEAANEREIFFQEINMSSDGDIQPPVSEKHKYQRLCIHDSNVLNLFLSRKPYCPSVSSIVCFSKEDVSIPTEHISAISAGFKLLRVLQTPLFSNVPKLPRGMYRLLHLRYLTISFNSSILPEAFSNFQNIQILVIYTTMRTLQVKAKILDMVELRHFKTNASATLPKPGRSSEGGEKIQTLGTISPASCTGEVFDRARNLKKLSIRGKLALLLEDNNRSSFDSLRKLENLEKLMLMNDLYLAPCLGIHNLPPSDKFPIKLRSLTLCETGLDWSYMSVLGSLENLKVLKLKDYAFQGRSWVTYDGGFPHLEVLHIEDTDLEVWVASHDHFPKLKSLNLRNCENLQEVQLELADVPSFQCLDLFRCRRAITASRKIYTAKKKQEDQQFGNVHRFSLSVFALCEI